MKTTKKKVGKTTAARGSNAGKKTAAKSKRGDKSQPPESAPAPRSSAEVAKAVRERLGTGNLSKKSSSSSNAKDTKLRSLFEQGKSKGFLTFDEVNDAIPDGTPADQIDDVVGALTAEDIQIVDGATQVKIKPRSSVRRRSAQEARRRRRSEARRGRLLQQEQRPGAHVLAQDG